MKILVAGSSGYFAGVLIPALADEGHQVTGLDILRGDSDTHTQIVCDASNAADLEAKTQHLEIEVIINLATQIDFASINPDVLYSNNVVSNQNLIDLGNRKMIRNFVYTSSNSIFLGHQQDEIHPDSPPKPIDQYGRSKVEAERQIRENKGEFFYQIIRCPNIVDAGRVGMLSILFELLHSDAALWVIGDGSVRHQTLYALDLANYIKQVINIQSSNVVNLGAENPPTMKTMFKELVSRTGSKSVVHSIPAWLALPLMKMLFSAGLSPLGPYQQRMLTRSFWFVQDWEHLPVSWKPTKGNTEMLEISYKSFVESKREFPAGQIISASRMNIFKGPVKLLTWIKF
jgi:nucleoside-diphosphate-sugar epimerase